MRFLLDHMPFPYFIIDEKGLILSAGSHVAQLLNRSLDDIIHQSIDTLYHPDDREIILGSLASFLSGEQDAKPTVARKQHGDGSTVWYRDHLLPFQQGDIQRVLLLSEDISAEKQSEAKWKEAENRYQLLVERVPAISYSVDLFPSPRTTYISPQIKTILGYTEEEWLSDDNFWNLCIHPEERDYVVRVVEQCNDDGNPFFLEYRARSKNGEYVWIRNHGLYLRNESGTPCFTHGIMIDITDTKRVEEREEEIQLRTIRAERMESIGRLAGGVAHDLNNILGSLVGYPELMLEELPADHPMVGDIKIIHDSAKRASAVIRDLLMLARRGDMTKQKAIDINAIVEEYFQSPGFTELQSQHPEVEFMLDLATSIPAVVGSSSNMQQLLVNLIINGLESVGPKGIVTVRTFSEHIRSDQDKYEMIPAGEYVCLQAHDNGTHVSPNDLEHLFEPFYTRRIMGRGGTGLGLPVVYGVVKEMNGFIDVSSNAAEGTFITVFIPISSQGVEASERKASQPPLGNERILVVDDLHPQRELARRVLTSLGYKVSVAGSVNEALTLLNGETFDLLLLDMILEEERDGLDLLQAVKADRPEQQCLIVTGYADAERTDQAISLGAAGCVRKPYTIDTIGHAVHKALST